MRIKFFWPIALLQAGGCETFQLDLSEPPARNWESGELETRDSDALMEERIAEDQAMVDSYMNTPRKR